MQTGIAVAEVALISYDLGQYGDALRHFERALRIFEQKLGPEHPNTRVVRGNLAALGDSNEE